MDTIVNCPYPDCQLLIMIYIHDINCGIFRHGVDAAFQPINPHASREDCIKNTVYGCGRPFRIVKNKENEYKSEICDYI